MSANTATVILSRIYTKKNDEDWSGVWIPGKHTDPRDASIFDDDEVKEIGSFNDPRKFEGYIRSAHRYDSDNILIFDIYFSYPNSARKYFNSCRSVKNSALDNIINDKKSEKSIPDYQVHWVLRNAKSGEEYDLFPVQ